MVVEMRTTNKIIFIFGLMIILMSAGVSAYFYGYDFGNIQSWDNPSNCMANKWSSCDMHTYYKIWDFDISDEPALSLHNIKEFEYYLFIDYDDRITQSPLNDSIKNFTLFCVVRNPDITGNSTTTLQTIINKTYTINDIDTNITSAWYYINVNAGGQLYCEINTRYYNHSVFYDVDAIRTRLYLPTYKSTYDYNKVIADKDATIENLSNQLINKNKSLYDLVLNSMTTFIKYNMELFLVFYWIIKIGLIFVAMGLIIYAFSWLYHFIKTIA